MKPKFIALAFSLTLILSVAFVARVSFAWDQERKIPRAALAVVPFAQETGNIAYALANGQGFSSPFRNNTGPTAWLVPVYPLLLAGIFRVFGTLSIHALNAAVLMNILFSTAACIPIFYVGERYAGVSVGTLAAWMWALHPAAIMVPFEWIWDTSLSALLAPLLLWATLWIAHSRKLGDWFAYGLFWGASLLANASLGSLFFPWLAWAAIRQSKQDKTFTLTAKSVASRWWQGPALAATVAVLCCVPWTVRNYLQFHRLIPLRSSFSFELWSGNNNIFDPHTGNAMARITLYGEVRQYTQLGESGYMQDKWRKTTLFIRTHPQLELRLLLARVISTWLGTQHPITDFIDTDSWLVRLVFLTNCLLLLGTLGGIFFLYRRRHPLTFPIAITPIIFPIVYYITHTSLRYRHPLDPMLILLTAMSIAALFRITNLESARE